MKRLLPVLLFISTIASAQQTLPFSPQTTATISASGTSANAAISGPSPQVVIHNSGAVTAFIKFGADSSVAATTSDYPVLAGATEVLSKGAAAYVAAITAGTAATVYVTSGSGQ